MKTTEKGIRPIVEKLLSGNMLLIMLVDKGALFAKVLYTDILDWGPFSAADENNTAINLAAQGNQAPVFFRDPRQAQNYLLAGQSMPYKSNNGFPHVLHGSFGVDQSGIRVYTQYPGKTGAYSGKFPGLPAPVVANGDDFGYVDNKRSPYANPTNFRELLLFPGKDVSFEFFNANPSGADYGIDSTQPNLRFIFGHYYLQLFKPMDTTSSAFKQLKDMEKAKALHDQKMIGKMARRELVADIIPAGSGDQLVDWDSRLSEEWKVDPIPFEEALAYGGPSA